MKVIGAFCFLKVLKNWQSVAKICHVDNVRYQNILAYRHILKSIVKKLEEKNQKFSFSKLDLSLPVHMQSAVLFPLILYSDLRYRLGMVNSKSFVGKILLRIKWKFELTVHFKHEMLGK